jgi:hypothetical protein
MRHAFATTAAALALAWASSTALAGPIAPTLQLQVLETWQTSSTVMVKGKKTTVITNHSASSGIIVDTTHTGRVEYQTASGQSFGTFSSLSAIGLGDPLIGSGLDDEVDLSSQGSAATVSGVVPGSITLTLLLTETGLTTNLGKLPFDAEIGGTLGKGMVLSYKTFLDPGDHPFGETIPLTSNSFPNKGAFSWEDSADKWLQDQFSMTELVTIGVPTSAAATGTSFDASLSTTVVSEPGTAMMLGLPLALIGFMAARRKASRVADPAVT